MTEKGTAILFLSITVALLLFSVPHHIFMISFRVLQYPHDTDISFGDLLFVGKQGECLILSNITDSKTQIEQQSWKLPVFVFS